MKILYLTPDAFGGRGGIANHNRCVIRALSASPDVDQVTVIQQNLKDPPGQLPDGVKLLAGKSLSRKQFIVRTIAQIFRRHDLIVCAHANLAPLAALVSRVTGVSYVTLAYGIDVWSPLSRVRTWALRGSTAIWGISLFTLKRLEAWSQIPSNRLRYIPCMIDLEAFTPQSRERTIPALSGVPPGRLLLTVARLDSRERYKGIDEVLECLSRVLEHEPDAVYCIAGEGDDRGRLEEKVVALGLSDHVRFLGYVPDQELKGLLSAADAFLMPGSGEGFGIVYLEALACGTNVVGSVLDASKETLLDGTLGSVVDPRDLESVAEGILEALHAPNPNRQLLEQYGWESFSARLQGAVADLIRR